MAQANSDQYSQIMDQQRELLLTMSTKMAEREAENANLRANLKQLEASPGRFVATPAASTLVGPSLAGSNRPIPRTLFSSPAAQAPMTMSSIGAIDATPSHTVPLAASNTIPTPTQPLANKWMDAPDFTPTRTTEGDIVAAQRTEISALHQRLEVLRGTLEELRQQRANQTELSNRERELAQERERNITDESSRQKDDIEKEYSQKVLLLQARLDEQEMVWRGRLEQTSATTAHMETQLDQYRTKAVEAEQSRVSEHEKVVSLQYQLEERDNLIVQLEKARADSQRAAELAADHAYTLENTLKERDAALNGAQLARDGEVKRSLDEKEAMAKLYEDERSTLQTKASDAEKKGEELATRLEVAENELARVREAQTTAEQAARGTASQLREVEAVNAALERQHGASLTELLQCQRDLAEATRRANSMAIDEHTVKAVRELEQRVITSETSAQQANTQLNDSNRTIQSLRDHISGLENDVRTAQQQVNEAQSSIARVSVLERALEESRREMTAKDAALRESGASVAAFRSLQIEFDRLKGENDALKLEGDQLKAYNARLAEEWARRGTESAAKATEELQARITLMESEHRAAILNLQNELDLARKGPISRPADNADVAHLLAVFQHEVQRVREQANKEIQQMKDSYEREAKLMQERAGLQIK